MAVEIDVGFPGNVKVEAKIRGFVLSTDQPEKSGGDDSGPTPFELFTSSIATCAGFFAVKFCRSRNIDTTGMSLKLSYDWDKELKRYPKMSIQLKLPEGFPDKYKGAIIKAMAYRVSRQAAIYLFMQCSVNTPSCAYFQTTTNLRSYLSLNSSLKYKLFSFIRKNYSQKRYLSRRSRLLTKGLKMPLVV